MKQKSVKHNYLKSLRDVDSESESKSKRERVRARKNWETADECERARSGKWVRAINRQSKFFVHDRKR